MGGTSYYNVVITVGSVISVGAVCATAAECSASNTSTEAVYYGPSNFANAIQASYTPGNMTLASTLTNRNRYLLSDSATLSVFKWFETDGLIS